MSQTLKLFPTLLYLEKWKGAQAARLNRQLKKEIDVLADVDGLGKRWSRKNYPFGYTSYSSVTDLPERSSNFAQLKDFIDRQVIKYAKILEIDFREGELFMSECWVNRMEKGCQHSYHLHPGSVISGTYYVDAPTGSGAFKIEDPRLPAFMGSAPRKLDASAENQRFQKIAPAAGTLVLFESWLKHEVEPHRGAKARVSVSFNYSWRPLTGPVLGAR